jgi:hypothetical protein
MPQKSLIYQSDSIYQSSDRPIKIKIKTKSKNIPLSQLLNVQYVNLEILYYIRVRNASLFNLPICRLPNRPIKNTIKDNLLIKIKPKLKNKLLIKNN